MQRKMRETKDLILKKAQIEDWADMYENLWSHPESARYMLWKPSHSAEEAKDRIEKVIAYQKTKPYEFFVYEKKSGKAIGFAGMEQIEDKVYEDTGIALGPAFAGKGYGKQILAEFVRFAFEELGAEKFVTSCRSENIASRKLQLSCGFTYSHSEDRVDPRNGNVYVLEFYELWRERI